MKTTAIRNLALGTLCASMIGAAGLASAADWHGHYYHGGGVVRSYGYGPRFGLGLGVGVVIGAPAYVAPAYVAPAYVEPTYIAPYYAPEVVIGGGYWGGSHYYRGGGYVRGGYSHRGRH